MGNRPSWPLPLPIQQPVQDAPSQIVIPVSQTLQQPISNVSNTSSSDIFLVDPVTQIHLQIPYHQIQFLWIEKRVYSTEMFRMVNRFSDGLPKFQQFNNVDQFKRKLEKHHGNTILRVISSLALPQETFRAINRNRYVDIGIWFCQNENLASEFSKRYPKFCLYAQTSLEVLQKASVISTFKNSILLMVPEDVPVMNKYWINFYCLLQHQDRLYSKAQFLELARHIYPNEQTLINEFDQAYSASLDTIGREKLVIEWMFKDSFYWNILEQLPKVTNDPKKLAYLRGPFKDIFETIQNNYKLIPNQVFNNLQVIQIVVELSQQEKEKLSQSINNFLIFTSFVKGFTSQIAANNFIKSQSNYKKGNFFTLDVVIPKKAALSPNLDYGFIIQDFKKIDDKNIHDKNNKSADVVFNIFNYFKVLDFREQTKSGILVYGGLADAYRRREREEYRNQLKDRELDLLQKYDSMSNEASKIRDQGSVLRLSGHIQDSIFHSQSRIEKISSIGVSNISIVQIDRINLQKGASLLIKQDYKAAIDTYLEIQSQKQKIIAHVRIVGIYIQLKQWENARNYLNRIRPSIQRLKNEWSQHEQYFRARHYQYWLLMQAHNYKDALTEYKQLKEDILQHYDYKTSVLPFMPEIIANLNYCSDMKNNAPIV